MKDKFKFASNISVKSIETPICVNCNIPMQPFFKEIGKGGIGGYECPQCTYSFNTDIIDDFNTVHSI